MWRSGGITSQGQLKDAAVSSGTNELNDMQCSAKIPDKPGCREQVCVYTDRDGWPHKLKLLARKICHRIYVIVLNRSSPLSH